MPRRVCSIYMLRFTTYMKRTNEFPERMKSHRPSDAGCLESSKTSESIPYRIFKETTSKVNGKGNWYYMGGRNANMTRHPPGSSLRDEMSISDLPSPEDFSEWLNLNSFAAHLYSEDMTYGSMYAMYHLRAALEEENASREIANRNISLASETHRVFGSRRTAVYNKGQRIGENGEKGKNGLLDFSNLEGLDGTSEFLSQ
ncbi:hypothetical protein V8E54_007761 [Elaphomyces granulatus]